MPLEIIQITVIRLIFISILLYYILLKPFKFFLVSTDNREIFCEFLIKFYIFY